VEKERSVAIVIVAFLYVLFYVLLNCVSIRCDVTGSTDKEPKAQPVQNSQQQSGFLSIINRDKKRGGRGLAAMLAEEDAAAENAERAVASTSPSQLSTAGTKAPAVSRSPQTNRTSTLEEPLNKLAAKAMKARLRGKIKEATKLEEKLRKMRESQQKASTNESKDEKVEVVAPYDIHGRRLSSLTKSVHEMPLERGDLRSGRGKGKRKASDVHAEHAMTGGGASNGGKKVGSGSMHGSADNNYSLQDLVRMEREGHDDDNMDKTYFRSVVQVRTEL